MVNALAKEMCSEHEEPRLREPRVRRVIEPLLSGGDAKYTPRDFEYVRDLGHVAPDAPLRIANPVYAELLPRELTWVLEHEMSQQTAWYVDPDGSLNLDKLLAVHQPRVAGQVLPHRSRTRQGFELARHADDGVEVLLGAGHGPGGRERQEQDGER